MLLLDANAIKCQKRTRNTKWATTNKENQAIDVRYALFAEGAFAKNPRMVKTLLNPGVGVAKDAMSVLDAESALRLGVWSEAATLMQCRDQLAGQTRLSV
jgi:hypothetical protein